MSKYHLHFGLYEVRGLALHPTTVSRFVDRTSPELVT